MPVGDNDSVKAAKALALPTRSAMLAHLLKSGSLTAREVAAAFSLHPNVARAHLDLLAEAGFLATAVRSRKEKGRPAKVYFTWEGEMSSLDDWEVSPPPGQGPPSVEMVLGTEPDAEEAAPNPYRLIAAILIRLVERVDSSILYPLAEQVSREEGAKLMYGYREGGLDFAAAVRALVEELRRFSPLMTISRLVPDEAELYTPDCAFRDIALEHPDLVSIIDPALKEGALAALGHPSEVEMVASSARGDPACKELIRRRDDSKGRRRQGRGGKVHAPNRSRR